VSNEGSHSALAPYNGSVLFEGLMMTRWWVETCSPCIYKPRYTSKSLCLTVHIIPYFTLQQHANILNWGRWLLLTRWFLRSLLAQTLFSHLRLDLPSWLCHLCIRDQFYTRFSSFFTYFSILTFLKFMTLIMFGEGYVLWKASSFLQGCAHPCDTRPLSAHLNNLSRFLWKSKMAVATKITTETRVGRSTLPEFHSTNWQHETMINET
jgi:hypothetical protein